MSFSEVPAKAVAAVGEHSVVGDAGEPLRSGTNTSDITHVALLAAPSEALDPILGFRSPLPRRIIAYRKVVFLAIAIFFVLAFNGVWIIGRDSALYRGLGHSLASGNGYHFGEFAPRTIYPGLPLLLAGIEKLFGPSDLAPLIVMNGFALAILILTYKLIRLSYPQWVAVTVAGLLGLNGRFLGLSSELLTDIPFLLGMMLALYGWERLKIASGACEQTPDDIHLPRSKTMPLILLIIGVVIAASFRPTFWILALAWTLVSAWQMLHGRQRRFYFSVGTLFGVLTLSLLAIDQYFWNVRLLDGEYGHEAVRAFRDMSGRIPANLSALLWRDMLSGFMGNRILGPINPLLALLVIGSSLMLLRRGHVLWTVLVYLTIAVTLLMSTAPRYFLMVLPLMLLGWVLLWAELARRAGPRWGDWVLRCGLLLILAPGIARSVRVVANQRGRNIGNYQQWAAQIEMAEMIRQLVPPGAKVIGPDGSTIMSYFSGRHVMMQRELLPAGAATPANWPREIAAMGIEYAIFPSMLYTESEREAGRLMRKGVILPERILTSVDVDGEKPMVLATIKVVVPPEGTDWRTMPVSPEAIAAADRARQVLVDAKAQAHAEAKAHNRAAAKAKARFQFRLQSRALTKAKARAEESARALAQRKADKRRKINDAKAAARAEERARGMTARKAAENGRLSEEGADRAAQRLLQSPQPSDGPGGATP